MSLLPADRAHRIRLPEPWQVTHIVETPARVLLGRSFQSPSGLTPQSRLTLEVQLVEPRPFSIKLNGQLCRTLQRGDVTFDVPIDQQQLERTNEIEIEIEIETKTKMTLQSSDAAADTSLSTPRNVPLSGLYLSCVVIRIE